MIRTLTQAEGGAALRLLRLRSLHNVFLEHVVRSGGLGRLPGFMGYFSRASLEGILLIGSNGGTALAGVGSEACAALGRGAVQAPVPPRLIVGSEDFTVPFWRAYAPFAAPLVWERREPVYSVVRETLRDPGRRVKLLPAREQHLEEIVANSAEQYREDLHDDRFAADPQLFRERHRQDVRERRWWILREDGRIVFQVHIGPENDRVVQIGGVFTVADRRNCGIATSGVAAVASQLLERRPAVSLFCDEANRAARRVYERLGFEERFHYRSWLLDTRGR
jgi:RimJ/RimL family protein N-acetyltransferase